MSKYLIRSAMVVALSIFLLGCDRGDILEFYGTTLEVEIISGTSVVTIIQIEGQIQSFTSTRAVSAKGRQFKCIATERQRDRMSYPTFSSRCEHLPTATELLERGIMEFLENL